MEENVKKISNYGDIGKEKKKDIPEITGVNPEITGVNPEKTKWSKEKSSSKKKNDIKTKKHFVIVVNSSTKKISVNNQEEKNLRAMKINGEYFIPLECLKEVMKYEVKSKNEILLERI